MVTVLRNFRQRCISPATRQRRAAEWGDVKRLSSARQALAMFLNSLLAGNYKHKRYARLNSWPSKDRTRLMA
eukprot:5955100-Heterocapsa_arctica.AAC.1